MNSEDIKRFIKDNLIIEVEYVQKMSPGNDMRVSLRFQDDDDSFTHEIIFIPDDD